MNKIVLPPYYQSVKSESLENLTIIYLLIITNNKVESEKNDKFDKDYFLNC